jgi:predicted amidohydrolase YtcJ
VKRDARDLVFVNGSFLDAARAGRSRRPKSEALWVRDGRIEALGPAAAIRARAGRRARRIDLGGGTLVPGFTDAHIHLVTWIRALREPWMDSQALAGIERAVAARRKTAPGNDWLLVRGWVPRDWPLERRRPEVLERIAPDRPLLLQAVDGHSVWGNRIALERTGIDERTAEPSGGRIERDAAGRLTGALIEDAANLLRSRVPRPSTPDAELRDAIAKAHALGITSAHDFDRNATWRAAASLAASGRLPLRLLISVPVAALDAAEDLGLAAGLGGDRLGVAAVKMFADGTLGSATALLESPYEGTRSTGIEVTPRARLAEACGRAARAGLSVAIHAIGDGAVRNALDAIESTLQAGARFPVPPRVEHIQLSRREDWPRFRALGVLASVQPAHMLSDREVAKRFWGSRTERSYAWRSLLAHGARLVFGSDAPFDRAGPLVAIQSAVLRRAPGEPADGTFHGEQRIRLAAALRAHLEDPHRAAAWPVPLGRLAPHFGADLALFDHDLLALPVEEWHRAKVRGVWIGGERVFGAPR